MSQKPPSRLTIGLRIGSLTVGYLLLVAALIVPAGLAFMSLPVVGLFPVSWGDLMRAVVLDWTLPVGLGGLALVFVSVLRRRSAR